MKRLNYVTTFLAEGLVIGSYLLTFRLVAVFTGTEGFGEYSLSRRTLSLLLPLAVLGVEVGIARYVSYAEAEKSDKSPGYAAAGLLLLAAGVAAVSAVLLVATSFWGQLFFGSARYADLVLALPPLMAGSGLHVIAHGYLRGLNRIQAANVLMGINMGLLPLGAILLFHGSVLSVLDAMALGWTVTSGLVLIRLPIGFAGVRDRLRDLARFGLPRMPGDVISLVLFAMPGILAAHYSNIRVAGMVAFGVAAVSMIGSSLTPVSFVLLPVAARLLAAGRVRQLRSEVVDMVGITLAATLVLVVVLEVFAGQIVNVYLGPSFKESVDILRLTLIGALPWAAYITLRSVIDAQHVRPINARNITISFAFALILAFALRQVADPTTGAVLAFVLALWLLAGLTMLEVNRIADITGGRRLERSPTALARTAVLAGLPVAILVSSPQRVWLSAVVALAYVVTALFSFHIDRVNRFMLAYVGVTAAWMILSWLRTKYLLHLTPEQLAYGTSKTMYFAFIVLPIAAAVAMMVNTAEDMWPAAAGQLALGLIISLVTVALLGDRILGYDRYQWQGNLIAVATLIAIQPWLIKNIWVSTAIGVLGIAGILFAEARQSLGAFGVALVVSAVYWWAARYMRLKPDAPRRILTALRGRWVVLPLGLLVLTVASIVITWHNPNINYCNCITDRIVIAVQTGAGDRDKMLERGLSMVLQDPVLGNGLGSFSGLVPDSLHPGVYYDYPHNVPLEVAAETGLIGFLLIIVPLILSWVALFWKGVQTGSPATVGVLMIVAVFFVVANVSGDIPSDRAMWIFGIVALKFGYDLARAREAVPDSHARRIESAPTPEAGM